MVVRIRGGQSGVVEYLIHGEKKDRSFSRNQLDKRVTLAGDLDVTNKIINSLDYSENYHHITLAFKEDYVSEEDLQKACDEFEKFIKAAYPDEELNFYAEAHMPKLKSFKSKNGELVIRKPHIHIVVPNVNMLTGKYMEPFGRVENNEHYINSFQELFNQNQGFASPKDHRRNEMNIESSIVARNKDVDLFDRNSIEKNEILELIVDQKIKSYQDLKNHLDQVGTMKIRNKGKSSEYLNVKFKHHNQGINLKEFCFSKEFIEEYSKEDKIDFLKDKSEERYIQKQEAYESKNREKLEELNKDWFDFRAKEIKYLNSGTKDYGKYKSFETREEKIKFLNQKEVQFYFKHNLKKQIEQDIAGVEISQVGNFQKNSNNKEIGNEREKIEFRTRDRSDLRITRGADVKEREETIAIDSMRDVSELPMVRNARRAEMLLSVHELDNLGQREQREGDHRVRRADFSDRSYESQSGKRSDSVVSQKLYDFEEQKALENIDFKGLLIKNTYDILKSEKGVLHEKIKYDPANNILYKNNNSHTGINLKNFLSQEMNMSANEIHLLQEKIHRLENQMALYREVKQMSINVNIVLNTNNPQKVDYYQLGREDAAGRYTGIIHDRASQYDTARAYVINDKVVSLEEFKEQQPDMHNEIKQKAAELFKTKTHVRYNHYVRCDIQSTEVKLTDQGRAYANSQHNMKQIKPVEMGITRFEGGKKLDKNFFTLAKEWVTAKQFRDDMKVKWHEFKQDVKAAFTSKPELAASNLAMAMELKQLKAELETIKTYQAAEKLAIEYKQQSQQQDSTQEQEQDKDPREMKFGEVLERVKNYSDKFENARDIAEIDQNFKDKRDTAIEFVKNLENKPEMSNLSEAVIDQELTLQQAKAANMMFDNGIKVESLESVDKFIETIKSVKDMCTTQNLNFENVLQQTLQKMSDKVKEMEFGKKPESEQDAGIER